MTPIHSRRFAWLALVAMLSLAMLPTFGRLATGQQHAGMAIADLAMASPMPAAVMAMPASHHRHHGASAASHAPASRIAHAGAGHTGAEHGNEHEGHEGHDCSYCLLLSGLVGAATLEWIPPASRVVGQPSTPAFTNRCIGAPVPALGGQGPPSIVMG